MQTKTTTMIKIGNNLSEWSAYSCQPKTKDELKKIIKDRISKEGYECDLNDIDVSLIEDMSYLFCWSKFTGNISKWDVSNVNNMEGMLYKSKFNQDISGWNVSNVKNMFSMFAYSNFNKDISNWKISKDCYTKEMFFKCPIKEEYKPELPE